MPTGSSIHTMVLFTSFVRKDRGVKDEKAYKIAQYEQEEPYGGTGKQKNGTDRADG